MYWTLAGSLEVYHNVTLKYAPKRLHFGYDSMRARTELAIMDHNMNVGRELKKMQEGNKNIFASDSVTLLHCTQLFID